MHSRRTAPALITSACLCAGVAGVAAAADLDRRPGSVLCHATAEAGGPYAAECQGPTTSLQLDGSRSPSCPGENIEYTWTSDCPGAEFDDPHSKTPVLTVTSPPPCPLLCTVTLEAVDLDLGGSDTDSATVTIEDSLPPTGAGPGELLATLWPPDHRYVCFGELELLGVLTDSCSGVADWQVISCTSSEPDDAPGAGDGRTRRDCVILDRGRRVCARAERAGSGAGREYEIMAEAVDGCGNSSGAVAIGRVRVTHDRR